MQNSVSNATDKHSCSGSSVGTTLPLPLMRNVDNKGVKIVSANDKNQISNSSGILPNPNNNSSAEPNTMFTHDGKFTHPSLAFSQVRLKMHPRGNLAQHPTQIINNNATQFVGKLHPNIRASTVKKKLTVPDDGVQNEVPPKIGTRPSNDAPQPLHCEEPTNAMTQHACEATAVGAQITIKFPPVITQYAQRRKRILCRRRQGRRQARGESPRLSESISSDCNTWSQSSTASHSPSIAAHDFKKLAVENENLALSQLLPMFRWPREGGIARRDRLLYHLQRQAREEMEVEVDDALNGTSCPAANLKSLMTLHFPLWAPPTFVPTCMDEPVPRVSLLFPFGEVPHNSDTNNDADVEKQSYASDDLCDTSCSDFSQSESDENHSFSSAGGAPKCHSLFLPEPIEVQVTEQAKRRKLLSAEDELSTYSMDSVCGQHVMACAEGEPGTDSTLSDEGNTHSNPMLNTSTSNSVSHKTANPTAIQANMFRYADPANPQFIDNQDSALSYGTHIGTLTSDSNCSYSANSDASCQSDSLSDLPAKTVDPQVPLMQVRGLFARNDHGGLQRCDDKDHTNTFDFEEEGSDSYVEHTTSYQTTPTATTEGSRSIISPSSLISATTPPRTKSYRKHIAIAKSLHSCLETANGGIGTFLTTIPRNPKECTCRHCVSYYFRPNLFLGEAMETRAVPNYTTLIGPSMAPTILDGKGCVHLSSTDSSEGENALLPRRKVGMECTSLSQSSTDSIEAILPMPLLLARQ